MTAVHIHQLSYPGPPVRVSHASDDTSGQPVGQDWKVGDVVEDSNRERWRCTVAGNPGTWERIAPTGTPDGTKFLADDGSWKTPDSGGSGPWTANVLDLTAPAWTAAANSSLPGAWTHAGGIISQTVDTADDALNYDTPLPARHVVIQFDVRFPTSQDAGTKPSGLIVAMSPPALDFGTFTAPITDAALLGIGGGLFALAAGDGTAFEAPPWVDGNIESGTTAAAVTITQDAWHTVRIDADLSTQVVYIDGAYLVTAQLPSGGNGLDTPNAGDCADRLQLAARGLVDFRNITVWTPALPA